MSYYRGSARKGIYESKRTNQTLMGLDNILDKYSRENKLLAQQVSKLRQENTKLKTDSFSKDDLEGRTYKKVLTPRWENIDLQPVSRSIEKNRYEHKTSFKYNEYVGGLNEEYESQKTKRREP